MQGIPAAVVEEARERAVEHLRALVRIDTSNPPGNEMPAARYVETVLAEAGIVAEVFEPAPGRANLVARLEGASGKGPLLLTSHLDVVPADVGRWTYPPFGAEIAEGCVWGRGTLDMKGLTAFQLATMVAVKQAGIALERGLILLALADEEDGQALGSAWMVEHHPELIRAEFAFNEVGGFSRTVGRRRLYLVGTAEKGVCWLRLRAHGEAGHGAIPSGSNAVAEIVRAVGALTRARLGARVTAGTRVFLDEVADAMGWPGAAVVRGLRHEPTRGAALAVMRRLRPADADALGAMLRHTVAPTGLAAGGNTNVVPAVAEATLDCRVLPGTPRDAFLRRLRDVAGPAVEVEVISWGDAREAPPESEAFDAVRAAIARHDPGARTVPWLSVGYTDAANLARLGIVTYGFYPLPLPADFPFAALFHGDDERVPLVAFRDGFGIFVDAVLGLATTRGASG